MSTAEIQLEAGGMLPAGTKGDAGATEQVVARTYHHPALGDRPVIRLTSDRLGEAEDLAMEFLGFAAPAVSPPIALQQRRSLGFAAWALINDPANARYALDLVKRMKAAARQARSKPGHAWEAYIEMAKDLGRSARHFLPPFWEEAGRTFKDLGNPTYAGRSLNKSLEAERVHALPADRARRRDVVLEFVLSGCLSGNALSEYSNDLQAQYPPAEAFAIFRDLCVRRTRGGMAPWAGLPKDFNKLAKAAGLDSDSELENWLEEVIDAPAMGRAPHQFWKTSSAHCKRIVARSPAFAVALLRHTRPEERYYGESKLGPWFDLLEEWGVLDYLWEDEHRGAPPLGEPIADWFGRVVRDEIPAPTRTLQLLEKLAPRLREEAAPLTLSVKEGYHTTDIDIDVLEACLVQGIKVADPPPRCDLTFAGWLSATVDHPFRNQDIVASARDERFRPAIFRGLEEALGCRGGAVQRAYRQANLEQRPFPLAAGDRPGIKALWSEHTSGVLSRLGASGLASFETAREQLASTLWPDALRLFPDLAEQLEHIDPTVMLQRTLQTGVFDEYGLPALEEVVDRHQIKPPQGEFASCIHPTFPRIVVSDKVHAYVINGDGTVKEHELRLPKKATLLALIALGDDLAVPYRDEKYQGHLFWTSNPSQSYEASAYRYHRNYYEVATVLDDGSVFLGQQAVRPGGKELPQSQSYLHDGSRFWRVSHEYDLASSEGRWKIAEVDPRTGKQTRESVPPWFEETEGGTIEPGASKLLPAPKGTESSPLGIKDGLLGWKVVKRRDGSYFGVGIDGRRWDRPLLKPDGSFEIPVALLPQPGTGRYLPVTSADGEGSNCRIWDPDGSTIVAELQDYGHEFARGQVIVLPLLFWHFLRVRDEASSRRLRKLSHGDCANLLRAAADDRAAGQATPRAAGKTPAENPLTRLLPAVKGLLPTAPERLVTGVARVVEHAEREAAVFAELRDKALADSKSGPTTATAADHRKSDLAAAYWGLAEYSIHHAEGTVSISDHLLSVLQFLKGEREAGDLPRTRYDWFPMLENLPLRCWQTCWRAQAAKASRKDGGEVPWLEFLKLWHELGIAALPGRFAIMEGHPEGAKKQPWGRYDVEIDGGTSFSIRNGDDRFIVTENQRQYQRGQPLPYLFLRYSTSDAPGEPPGFRVKDVRTLKVKEDPAGIAAFLAAAESSTGPPVPSRQELEEVARRLGVSPAEVALVWLGGLNLESYEHHFLPGPVRQAVSLKAAEANTGRQALCNLDESVREHLYESVVASGCAAPFADDRGPVLRQIEEAWCKKTPRRLPLDAELQTRLSAMGKNYRWQQSEQGELLAAAADPANHPALRPREIWIEPEKDRSGLGLAVKKNEQVITRPFLRSIVQLVALVHAETPAGNPARAAMPELIGQTSKLLEHPGTLLDLRTVWLFDITGRKKPLTPAEWLNKHVGKTSADAKGGFIQVDEGLIAGAAFENQKNHFQNQVFLAFRPAKLKDAGDLARLLGLFGIDAVVGEDEVKGDMITSVVAIQSPGFQKLAKAIIAETVPHGQWHQNPRHTAPQVVQAIQEKHRLGEDAAVLYAQLLALPDPTTANVRAWNGWTAAQFQKAAAELVSGKLVLEASRARAGRSVFLPGEWLELKAPWLPVERWKLAHLVELDKDPHDPCPAGGPMVLRPFADLFAAAWQRVEAGDEPRYEEVKPKKSKKK